MELSLNWNKFKDAHATQEFNINYLSVDDTYNIWGTDGTMGFFTTISTITVPNSGSDQYDFETNYLNNPDIEMNKKSYGRPLVQSTARPEGTTSYFTCAGDNENTGEISGGDELVFSLTGSSSGEYAESIIHFNETIWFKDGQIWSDKNTPIGAYCNIEVLHPVYDTVVGSFGRKIFLMPDWIQPLNTEDRGEVPYFEGVGGGRVRIRIYNSDGTGIKDQPAAFKATGRVEIYRKNQV